MKKRGSSSTSVLPNLRAAQEREGTSALEENGCFTFPNGDRYEGAYETRGESSLVRQGHGIYYTDDYNKYECVWDGDKIAADLHIRHNNGTAYKGSLDENGRMSGQGTYYFPDGASISATEWKQNKLYRDIRYREPLGFIWKGKLSEDGKAVEFMAGNHFWDDMNVSNDEVPEEH